jgi:hypothetical protein
MPDSLERLSFEDSHIKGLASDKQSYAIVKWLSRIYVILADARQPIAGEQQRFVVDELIKLIDYIGNAQEKEQIASKAVRIQIAKVFRAVYSGEAIHHLYETVNKMVSLLNGSGEKYSVYKQYVHWRLSIRFNK